MGFDQKFAAYGLFVKKAPFAFFSFPFLMDWEIMDTKSHPLNK